MTSKRAMLVMACAVSATAMLVASRAETKRTVYVSMLDAKGAAVTDLTAADLAIKEGGQDRSIASVAESTDPMDIAILDDDDGSGFYAPAVLQFIQLLGDRAQYSITNFTPPPVKVMDYTNDVAQIQTALDKIGKRGKVQNVGEQLESAISTTARELMGQTVGRPSGSRPRARSARCRPRRIGRREAAHHGISCRPQTAQRARHASVARQLH